MPPPPVPAPPLVGIVPVPPGAPPVPAPAKGLCPPIDPAVPVSSPPDPAVPAPAAAGASLLHPATPVMVAEKQQADSTVQRSGRTSYQSLGPRAARHKLVERVADAPFPSSASRSLEQPKEGFDQPGVDVMAGYTIARAESHEAAAKLFDNHPHFTIFPGDSVEIMERLPLPGR